ncbi:MAG: nicotinate-nucleotide adenylyltransferase [Methylococcaceae bacterium]|nr:nicotinate-nucleotide adenylyltransferase [Methylococcaceae bacterium]
MLGIYGGTFDPIHYGHLRTALEVKEHLRLEQLRFLPCRLPPHRGLPGAMPQQRLRMLELALEGAGPGYALDRREFDREGPSYMVDTLISLREEIQDLPLCLIVGVDAFYQLPSWHRWRELFDLAHIAVMHRPGMPEPDWSGELGQQLRERWVEDGESLRESPGGKIHFLAVTQLAISATGIRRLIHAGGNPRYLLPDPVLAMIQEWGLYRS